MLVFKNVFGLLFWFSHLFRLINNYHFKGSLQQRILTQIQITALYLIITYATKLLIVCFSVHADGTFARCCNHKICSAVSSQHHWSKWCRLHDWPIIDTRCRSGFVCIMKTDPIIVYLTIFDKDHTGGSSVITKIESTHCNKWKRISTARR